MRLRVVVAITLTVAAYAVAAFTWRQVFPFRDGLAEFLPEGTIAYVHVNLTPQVRRGLPHWLSSPTSSPSQRAGEKNKNDFPAVLQAALDSYDVRELGLVWHKADALPPQLALIVGQRASAQPDVMPATTVSVGEQGIRTFVVRVQTSGRNTPLPQWRPEGRRYNLPSGGEGEKVMRVLRRHPVQAVFHPRELPLPALEAARHLLPETVTASGIVDRRGFVLRSDGRLPLIVRSTRTELLAEPRLGTFQIVGLPVRAIVEQFDLPFHGELRAAIEPLIPERADLLIVDGRVAIRMPTPTIQPLEAVLRTLVARIWPVARPRQLDGLPANVLVADPNAFEVTQTGSSRWVLKSKEGDIRIFTEQSEDFVILATDEAMVDRMKIRPEPVEGQSVRSILRPFDSAALRSGSKRLRFRTYSACHFNDRSSFIVWPIHPQGVVAMSVDQSGSNVAICGRIAQQEN